MKTSELTGAQLDYWVAKAEREVGILRKDPDRFVIIDEDGRTVKYEPSTNWAQGGPIIERERISIEHDGYGWDARIGDRSTLYSGDEHATPLIAAMRTYVSSKFGDEVPDES